MLTMTLRLLGTCLYGLKSDALPTVEFAAASMPGSVVRDLGLSTAAASVLMGSVSGSIDVRDI